MTQQRQGFEHVVTVDDVHGTWHKQMVRHPYRGKTQLLRTPRHPENALNVYRFAVVWHTYSKLHAVSPSPRLARSVAAELRRPFVQKGAPACPKILGIKWWRSQRPLGWREIGESRLVQDGLRGLFVHPIDHRSQGRGLARHGAAIDTWMACLICPQCTIDPSGLHTRYR